MEGNDAAVAAAAGAGILIFLVWLVFLVLMILGLWKIFSKAGQPGWAAIIPIYNAVVLLDIIHKPVWWIILLLIPLVNVIMAVICAIELAKVFGKGTGMAIGLILLAPVFLPILGFGSAEYQG
jgi:hypothetical protein